MKSFNKAENTAYNERIYNAIADAAVEVAKHLQIGVLIPANSYTAAELSEKVTGEYNFEENYIQIEKKDFYVEGKMHHEENYVGPFHEISVDNFHAKIADAYIFQYLYKYQKSAGISAKVQRNIYVGDSMQKESEIMLYSFTLTESVIECIKAADVKNDLQPMFSTLMIDTADNYILCTNGKVLNVVDAMNAGIAYNSLSSHIDMNAKVVIIPTPDAPADSKKLTTTMNAAIPVSLFKKVKKDTECTVSFDLESGIMYASVAGKKIECNQQVRIPNYKAVFPYLSAHSYYSFDAKKVMKIVKSFDNSIYTKKDTMHYATLSGKKNRTCMYLSAYNESTGTTMNVSLPMQQVVGDDFMIGVDLQNWLKRIPADADIIYIPENATTAICFSNWYRKDTLSLMQPYMLHTDYDTFIADNATPGNVQHTDVEVQIHYNHNAFSVLSGTIDAADILSISVTEDSMLKIQHNDKTVLYAESTISELTDADNIHRFSLHSYMLHRLITLCYYFEHSTEIDDASVAIREKVLSFRDRVYENINTILDEDIADAPADYIAAEIESTATPTDDVPTESTADDTSVEVPTDTDDDVEVAENATESISTPTDDVVPTDAEKSAEIASDEEIAVSIPTDDVVVPTDDTVVEENAPTAAVESIDEVSVPAPADNAVEVPTDDNESISVSADTITPDDTDDDFYDDVVGEVPAIYIPLSESAPDDEVVAESIDLPTTDEISVPADDVEITDTDTIIVHISADSEDTAEIDDDAPGTIFSRYLHHLLIAASVLLFMIVSLSIGIMIDDTPAAASPTPTAPATSVSVPTTSAPADTLSADTISAAESAPKTHFNGTTVHYHHHRVSVPTDSIDNAITADSAIIASDTISTDTISVPADSISTDTVPTDDTSAISVSVPDDTDTLSVPTTTDDTESTNDAVSADNGTPDSTGTPTSSSAPTSSPIPGTSSISIPAASVVGI